MTDQTTAPDLFAIRVSNHDGKFLSGTVDAPKFVTSPYDALYWEREIAEKICDILEAKLGWQTWLIAAPEGST